MCLNLDVNEIIFFRYFKDLSYVSGTTAIWGWVCTFVYMKFSVTLIDYVQNEN